MNDRRGLIIGSCCTRKFPVVGLGLGEKRVHYQGNPNQQRPGRNKYILARRLALQTHAYTPTLIKRAKGKRVRVGMHAIKKKGASKTRAHSNRNCSSPIT